MVRPFAIGKAFGLAAATPWYSTHAAKGNPTKRMRIQKAIATVIILAGSVLVAGVFRDIAFPAALCTLGLLGLQRRFTWQIRPERRVIPSLLLLVLATLFALHYTYSGLAHRAMREQAAVIAWGTISRYFLASMILVLFLGSRQRLPLSLALFYMATVVSAGQILLLNDYYMPFRLLEAMSVVLIVLYATTGTSADSPVQAVPLRVQSWAPDLYRLIRRCPRRWIASGLILLFAVNLGWVTGSILYRHAELLNYVPLWLWRTGAMEGSIDGAAYVGFSTSGELSNILLMKGDQDTTPVLRIASDASPGYLRARAFDLYRQSRWTDVSAAQAILPSQNMTFGASLPGRLNYFRLSDRHVANAREMMIRHELPVRDAIFTPLGTLVIEAPLPHLNYDDDGIVSPPYPRMSLNYRITYGDRTCAPPPPNRSMLNLPKQLDPRVKQLADRIFAGSATTAEKIDAVVNHFRTHYTYSLGVSIPPGVDKLEYFLLQATSGYCEYFASGAAILLRLVDVPTRYVTGFLVTEKEASGDTWVARNMDAHAWVEAWDDENNQWTIVEATVQDGLATASANESSDGSAGLGRYLLLEQLVHDLYEYGLFGVLAWALQFYGLPVASFLLAATAAGVLWWLYRRARAARCRSPALPLRPELIALHRLLAYVDRRVKTAGRRRAPEETLQAFAHRLRATDPNNPLWLRIADWYLEYADLRYSKQITISYIQNLQRRARLLDQP